MNKKTTNRTLEAIAGLATLAAYTLCTIGATANLLADSHYLFAVATIAVCGLAFKSVKEILNRTLL